MRCWSNSGSVSVFLNFWLIFCPCPLIFKQNEFILFWENLNSAGDQIISSLYSQIWSYCIQRLNESPSFAKCLWAIRRIFLFPQSLVVPEVDATALTRWHEHVWDGAPGEEQTTRNQAASQWFKSSEPGGRPHSHESPLSLPLGRTHTHTMSHSGSLLRLSQNCSPWVETERVWFMKSRTNLHCTFHSVGAHSLCVIISRFTDAAGDYTLRTCDRHPGALCTIKRHFPLQTSQN